jgi:hypothetical protein
MLKIIVLGSLLLCGIFVVACEKTGVATSTTGGADTPTAAYKRLFAAVKSKDVDAIKKEMSKKTIAFAESAAARQNTPMNKVYENGFTATTFSETLPEIRDERVSGDMGAIEVYNSKESKWEDLPFVMEDGSWKLAIGDLFAGTYQSPGKGRAQKEAEAANASGVNNATIIKPDMNSAQVTNVPMPDANKVKVTKVPMPSVPPSNTASNANHTPK